MNVSGSDQRVLRVGTIVIVLVIAIGFGLTPVDATASDAVTDEYSTTDNASVTAFIEDLHGSEHVNWSITDSFDAETHSSSFANSATSSTDASYSSATSSTDVSQSQNVTVDVVVQFDDADQRNLDTFDDTDSSLRTQTDPSRQSLDIASDVSPALQVEREFWITNAALVSVDPTAVTVDELESIDGVDRVHANHMVMPMESTTEQSVPANTLQQPRHAGIVHESIESTNGIDQINATAVWDRYDTRGDGVNVAVIDTGVDVDHPDVDLYTENESDPTFPGGWAAFDPLGNEVTDSTPADPHGHGTHVSATLTGGDESGSSIGVAPNATLHHANVFEDNVGTFAQVLAGLEWAIESDVDVISMSLGTPCSSSDSTYVADYIDPIRTATENGIVVVGAIGNDGHGCTSSPGNVYDTLSVGATDGSGSIASFSGGEVIDTESAWSHRAHDDWPEEYIAPDVVAPGVTVKSAASGGGYETMSGTSMATPHVAGTAALIQGATDRSLAPQTITDSIRDTASHPSDSGQDTRYGHGIVDAYTAIADLHTDTHIEGTINDEVSGDPIPNASVSITSTDETISFETITDSDGTFESGELFGGGTYNLTISASGYTDTTHSVTIDTGDSTTVQTSLLGTGSINGTVIEQGTGTPLSNVSVTASNGRYVYETKTTAAGEFDLDHVAETTDTYDLSVSHEDYVTVTQSINVSTGSHDGDPIALAPAGNAMISGTVTDELTDDSITDATVRIGQVNGELSYSAAVTETGTFAVDSIQGDTDSPIEYEIVIDAPGYETEEVVESLSSTEQLTVDARLSGTASVSGTVIDGSSVTSSALSNSSITIEYASDAQYTFYNVTNATGSFEIDGLRGDDNAITLIASNQGYSDNETSFLPQSEQTVSVGQLELHGAGTVTGTVVDGSAQTPVTNATITAITGSHNDSPQPASESSKSATGTLTDESGADTQTYQTVTTANGSYTLQLPSNITAAVTADRPGYEPTTTVLEIDPQDGFMRNTTGDEPIHQESDSVANGTDSTIVIPSNFTLTGTASINGTVDVNSNTSNPDSITVTASNDHRTYQTIISTTGSFTLDGIATTGEEYTVTARARGFDTTTAHLDNITDHRESIDFVLDQRARYIGIETIDVPSSVVVGSAVEVDTVVRNFGSTQWNDTITLEQGGETRSERIVDLEPGEERWVTLSSTSEDQQSSTYSISTANETKHSTVVITEPESTSDGDSNDSKDVLPSPPSHGSGPDTRNGMDRETDSKRNGTATRPYSVFTHDLATNSVTVGKPIRVFADVETALDDTQSVVLELTTNGKQAEVVSFDIAPSEVVTVEFEHIFDSDGTYDLAVNDHTVGTVIVRNSRADSEMPSSDDTVNDELAGMLPTDTHRSETAGTHAQRSSTHDGIQSSLSNDRTEANPAADRVTSATNATSVQSLEHSLSDSIPGFTGGIAVLSVTLVLGIRLFRS